jgi:radical SAM superfamily enzyme YgiQ (UPF0313 family)
MNDTKVKEKILFVTTLKQDMVKVWLCQQTSFVGSLVPPADLAYIATYLQKKISALEIKILDLRLFKDPLAKYKSYLKEHGPKAVVLNLTTATASYDYEIIKNTPPSIKKVCFGSHAVALPDEVLQKGFDFILSGDPEKAMLELLKTNWQPDKNVKGLLTTANKNNKAIYFDDLDEIPFQNISLIDIEKYHAPYIKKRSRFTMLMSSRGCPFKCSFCLNPVFFGPRYRSQTKEHMVEELAFLAREHGISEVVYLDATFNTSEKRVVDFCEHLLEKKIKMRWAVNMRADPCSLEMLKLMKKAGCTRVMFGVEDLDLLTKINKSISAEKIIKAFANAKKARVSAIAYIMLFPDTKFTEKSYVKHMLNILKVIKADAFQCNICIPFPGSELFNKMDKEYSLKKDWSLYDPSCSILPYNSSLDLVKIRKKIILKYPFYNPLKAIATITQLDLRTLKALLIKYFENIRKT